MKNKKIIKKYIKRVVLIVITLSTFIISMSKETAVNLSYKEQNNLSYKVNLKKNNHYETSYLEKDMYYIASLINDINIDFNYNFKINKAIDYKYKYYVESKLTIFEKGKSGNIIFEKTEKLTEDVVENDVNSNSFNITKNLIINYNEYNELVKEFKSKYNILADSNLKITLYIETNGVCGELQYPVNANNMMEIAIPLTEQMINISTNYKESNSKDVFINEASINKGLLCFSIIFGIFTLMYITKPYFFGNKKSTYKKQVEKILKNYDRVIAEVKNILPIQNEIIEVISFEELLDISDRLTKPILFQEIEKDKRSWFIVKNKEEIYRYILGDRNLDGSK